MRRLRLRRREWPVTAATLPRALVALSLVLALVGVGCSRAIRVGMDQYPPEGTKRTQVTTRDGLVYDFSRTYIDGDSLIGAFRKVEERVTREGNLAYVDVNRATRLPLSNIAFVEYKQFDVTGTALVGAGAAVLVAFVTGLSAEAGADKDPDYGGSSDGKPIDSPPE